MDSTSDDDQPGNEGGLQQAQQPPVEAQQQGDSGSESDGDSWETASEDEESEAEGEDAQAAAAAPAQTQYGCAHYRRRCERMLGGMGAAKRATVAGAMPRRLPHLSRRVKLVAPCCGEVFWCRHCHNAAKSDNEQVHGVRESCKRDESQGGRVSHHACCELLCACRIRRSGMCWTAKL